MSAELLKRIDKLKAELYSTNDELDWLVTKEKAYILLVGEARAAIAGGEAGRMQKIDADELAKNVANHVADVFHNLDENNLEILDDRNMHMTTEEVEGGVAECVRRALANVMLSALAPPPTTQREATCKWTSTGLNNLVCGCNYCGYPDEDYKFCPFCGLPIEIVIAAQPEAAPGDNYTQSLVGACCPECHWTEGHFEGCSMAPAQPTSTATERDDFEEYWENRTNKMSKYAPVRAHRESHKDAFQAGAAHGAQQGDARKPDGYMYRHYSNFGGTVISPHEIHNGKKPIETLPYWYAQPPPAASDALVEALLDLVLQINEEGTAYAGGYLAGKQSVALSVKAIIDAHRPTAPEGKKA